ncbi:hypothetical protein B0H14DRAFT_262014 [Mycena olivaceomarginata]|nr:hypothetical protein B0H14DRAFT_637251 [Mycena olivaceomarginata]KAJ7788378.1 hypothetical protein B0H14DRAFT_262014 [Mycena olivaceomarginata]
MSSCGCTPFFVMMFVFGVVTIEVQLEVLRPNACHLRYPEVKLALWPRCPARVHIVRCMSAFCCRWLLMSFCPLCCAFGGTVATIGFILVAPS